MPTQNGGETTLDYKHPSINIVCVVERSGDGWAGRINVLSGQRLYYSVHSGIERPNKRLAMQDAEALAKKVQPK